MQTSGSGLLDARKILDVMRAGLAQSPDIRSGTVLARTVDSDNVPQSYSVEIDGAVYTNVPAVGTSFGVGQIVSMMRVGGAAVGDYQIAGAVSPYGTESPTMIGGLTSYTPTTFPSGVGFHVNGEGSWVIGGQNTSTTPGVIEVTGTRSEVHNYGIVGYYEDLMTFGLFNDLFAYSEASVDYTYKAGDVHLGLLDKGHIALDSQAGTFAWKVGNNTVLESFVVDGHGYTQIRDLLRCSQDYIGAGIELGRQPGGADIFQILNDYGVPLIAMRAGLETDANYSYARIGPPPPFPALVVMNDGNGNPILALDGEISALSANLGTVTAGRAQFLAPGTSFTSWSDYGTASGVVVGYDTVNHVGVLLGLEAGVAQAYFGGDGKLYGGAGNVVIDSTGILVSLTEADQNLIRIRGVGASPTMYNDCYSDLADMPTYIGRRGGGTYASPTKALTDMTLAHFGGGGYFEGGGADFTSGTRGGMSVHAANDYDSGGSTGTYLAFYTTPIGDVVPVEALRVGSDKALTAYGAISGITTLAMTGQLTSTLATGTKPLNVSSTTLCSNLNADLLDGKEAAAFLLLTGGTITGNLIAEKDAASIILGCDVYSDTATNTPYIRGRRARGSKASTTKTLADDPLLTIGGFQWYGTTGFPATTRASISIHAAENADTVNDLGTYIKFTTTPINSTTAAESMRLDGAGVLNVIGSYQVDGVQVVTNRVVDARCDDTINTSAWDSTTAGVLDSLRDAMITHGLIAAA